MIIGWCFICAFAVLINKVFLDVTVEGVIGGSVVLPCSSTEHDLKLQDINVLWKNKDATIYNLIKGKASVEHQDQQYKNRAQTFPEDYDKGNFSIKLSNLTDADAGEFSCFITHADEFRTVQLIVKEKGNNTTEQENQGPEMQSNWRMILIVVFALLLVLIAVSAIAYFMFCKEKRPQGVL